jgi:hypothetical protein
MFMNKKLVTTIVMIGLSALCAACTAAQATQAPHTAEFRAFLDHPNYCQSLVEKRIAGRPMAEGVKADKAASDAYSRVMELAGNEQQQYFVLVSMLTNCTTKVGKTVN